LLYYYHTYRLSRWIGLSQEVTGGEIAISMTCRGLNQVRSVEAIRPTSVTIAFRGSATRTTELLAHMACCTTLYTAQHGVKGLVSATLGPILVRDLSVRLH
jgi:hypothetical protein